MLEKTLVQDMHFKVGLNVLQSYSQLYNDLLTQVELQLPHTTSSVDLVQLKYCQLFKKKKICNTVQFVSDLYRRKSRV